MDEVDRRKSERMGEMAAKEQADKRAAELRSAVEGKVNKVRVCVSSGFCRFRGARC